MLNKPLTGLPERPQSGSCRRAHVVWAQTKFVTTSRARHPHGDRGVLAKNRRAKP